MAFYIMPPQGNSQLGTLMEDTKTRLIYLCELCRRWGDEEKVQKLLPDNPELACKCDSLIEGTKRDTESYFILKLASMSNGKFEAFLTEAETHFFEHRLTCGGNSTIKRAVAKAVKHSAIALETWGMTDEQQEFMTHMGHILQTIMKSGMSECHDRELCHHSLMVPWTLVLPLVRTRAVALHDGQAVVECHQVVYLLCCLFNQLSSVVHMQLGRKVEEAAQNDERLSDIMRRLQGLFKSRWLGGNIRSLRSLRHEEVERESKYFPLCMKQLFRKLQQKNRLRHHERYRFTLFLKDIGLPLEENLAFWRTYYSRSPGGGCQHTWEAREKRYIYSIRHVYGLEGARYNRSSHSCSKLQSIEPNQQDMGGCPLSGNSLEEVLPHMVRLVGPNRHILEVISKEVSASRPMAACQTLMAFTKHMKSLNRTNHNPTSRTSGGSLACAENHVNILRNVNRSAVQTSAGSQVCVENSVNVPSDVSRSTGKNLQNNASKSAESFAYSNDPLTMPSVVSGFAQRLTCSENHYNALRDVRGPAGENQRSDLVHLVTAEQPQCPGLSPSGCSGCHMNTGQGKMLSASGGAPTSGISGAHGASTSLARNGPSSCREGNLKMKSVGSRECSTKDIPLCDIEDIMGLMPKCVFHTPLQYYLKIVNSES